MRRCGSVADRVPDAEPVHLTGDLDLDLAADHVEQLCTWMGVRLCEVGRRPADLDRLDVTTLVNEGTGDAVLRVSIVAQPNPLAGPPPAPRPGRLGGPAGGVQRLVHPP